MAGGKVEHQVPETIGGESVDQRYYLSLIALGATLVVAWALSQLHQDPPASTPPAPSENSTLSELAIASNDKPHPGGSNSQSRRTLVAADSEPLIPGLSDDVDQPSTVEPTGVEPALSMATNSTTGAKLELRTPTGSEPSRGWNGVPLRPISSGPVETPPLAENAENAEVSKITQDGSSPRLRPLPTFSMPNTQTRSNPTFDNPNPSIAPNQPVGTQDPTPSPTILRPIVSDNYRALETQTSEPQPLPGERHVLRPIIRSQAPVSSPEPRSEFPPTPDSIWDSPMPGLKRRGPIPTDQSSSGQSSNGQSSNGQSSSGQSSNGLTVSNPATGVAAPLTSGDPAFATSGDPLFFPVGSSAGPNGANLNRELAGTSPPVQPDARTASTRPTTTPRSAGRPRPQSSDYIWHVIQQNQSLESISFQYQGDGNLVPRILELNRDHLTDPRLLPIGKAIRIPIR